MTQNRSEQNHTWKLFNRRYQPLYEQKVIQRLKDILFLQDNAPAQNVDMKIRRDLGFEVL